MKNRKAMIIIFLLSMFTLLISLRLFYNLGLYTDEYGSSPVLVSGGWFWLTMDWIRLALIVGICIISGIKLLKQQG